MQRILGQSRALGILQTQLASQRLHHAYIFHGPGGVGKFTTALAFAQVLLCHQPQRTLTGEVEPCGTCDSCRWFVGEAGKEATAEAAPGGTTADNGGEREDDGREPGEGHPDMHVVRKELAMYSDDAATRSRKLTQIPTAVLRSALLEPAWRRATMGHGKVFIVDEAELLNATGQNLLLKTLEEPPTAGPDSDHDEDGGGDGGVGRTTMILVTASEDRLLPTIRSRCQRVGFVPIPNEALEGWLAQRDDVAALSDRERQWLVSFAGGSLGRAEMALEYDLVGWARTVLPEVAQMSETGTPRDPALGQTIAQLIDELAQAWVDRHDNASKEAANKLAAGLMWSMVATYARRRLAAGAEAAAPAESAATEASLQPWLAVIEAVSEAQMLLDTNVNAKLVCDHLVSRMASVLGPGK